jgi:hypothetical protein
VPLPRKELLDSHLHEQLMKAGGFSTPHAQELINNEEPGKGCILNRFCAVCPAMVGGKVLSGTAIAEHLNQSVKRAPVNSV